MLCYFLFLIVTVIMTLIFSLTVLRRGTEVTRPIVIRLEVRSVQQYSYVKQNTLMLKKTLGCDLYIILKLNSSSERGGLNRTQLVRPRLWWTINFVRSYQRREDRFHPCQRIVEVITAVGYKDNSSALHGLNIWSFFYEFRIHIRLLTIAAVSYTHLDVYKRQI